MAAFFGLSAFLAAFAFLAGAAEDFVVVVVVEDFGAVATEVFAAVLEAVLGAAGFAAVLVLRVLVVELADSPLAASFSDATAVSRALVAVLIAVNAVVSALADVPAWVAAVFSFVAAVDTLVAAAVTVRGVTAVVRLADTAAVLLAAVRPAPFLLAAVLLAPVLLAAVLVAPVLLAAVLVAPVLPVVGRAAVRALVAVAGLAAAARVAAGLLAASVVPGVVAVVFVGTDLPPDMDQLRGRHSTESNLLHLMTRKNNGKTAISVT